MLHEILKSDFFNRKTALVAKELLGKFLVRRAREKMIESMITEVEAYVGPHDLASHASNGRTARNDVMFQSSGTIYVYLVYGMHEMLNIVTEKSDYPSAILIRGTEIASGPGRVTKKFHINRAINGLILGKKTGLWIEDRGIKILPKNIKRTARIGVSYSGPIWSKKKLRFVLN